MTNKPLMTDLKKALGDEVDSFRGRWVAIRFDEVIANEEILANLLKTVGDIHAVVVFIPKDDAYDNMSYRED